MIGFRIRRRVRAVSEAQVQAFREIPVANVSDCMHRMFAGGPALRPMHDGTPMAGPAFTVRTRPGDNLMIHKALHMASPGDVIVVDGGGDLTNALIGELMVATAVRRGLAGMVLYGAIRDARTLRAGSFPVFAAGVTHRGPYKDGPGEINEPISIGGMVIAPGDLVLGDDDGVLAVPFDQVSEVLAAAREKSNAEAGMMRAIQDGTQNIDWIDAALKQRGCRYED
ncbi:MAG: RraA family protein [Burkholderiaceae bacterium]